MKLSRRHFLHLTTAAAVVPLAPRVASALDYPTRPIHLIVGFPAGGPSDLIGRLIGQWLSDHLGQPIVIENRVGASSNIATAAVIRALPDGYTLLQMTSVNSLNVALYDDLKFDFIRDLVPVASIYRGFQILVVHPSIPAKTLPEFIAYAKSQPGKVTMASAGVGSPEHVDGALFMKMTGVELLHVPYRGGGPALTALLAGHVQVMFGVLVTTIEHIRSGELRALGVTAAARAAVLPDVPAIAEVVPDYEASGWQGIAAPVGTQMEIVDKLNKEVNAALADAKFNARLVDLGAEPFATSRAEFAKFVVAYTEKWTKVIRDAGIKAE